MVAGYWRDMKQTEAAFAEINGKRYYRTGDIGEWRNEKGGLRLRVIDRCGALVKLAQGEWVSPARIETTLEQCPAVQQVRRIICLSHSICADHEPPIDALASPLLGAGVRLLRARLHRGGGGALYPHCRCLLRQPAGPCFARADHCRHPRRHSSVVYVLRSPYLSSISLTMSLLGTAHHMRPIEIPQRLHLEHEAWTSENGMLTATEKKRRTQLLARYKPVINALYASTPVPALSPVRYGFHVFIRIFTHTHTHTFFSSFSKHPSHTDFCPCTVTGIPRAARARAS